jgi:2-dehydropantoate 2-reductase
MADAGVQDVVLLTLKAHQVKDVLPDMRALFGPDTMVVTMQNGIPWWYFHKLAGPWRAAVERSTRAASSPPTSRSSA